MNDRVMKIVTNVLDCYEKGELWQLSTAKILVELCKEIKRIDNEK